MDAKETHMPRRSDEYEDDDERYRDFGPDDDPNPDYDIRRRRPPAINSYLAPAILCTLFCCPPFGVVAIVYAAQVSGKLAGGDYAGAEDSANKAQIWCWVSFGVFVGAAVLYAAVIALAGINQGGVRF
jgi:hypothetical protein